MRSRCRFRPALAWLAWAALAATPAAAAEAAAPPIRLLSPADGAALVAGGTSELVWEPLPAFEQLAQAEEWEAFLSLDGGLSYPLRLTPHLDQDVRRIAWRVPPLASADARLLLRFGDEHRETAVPLPHRLVIQPPPVALPLGDETFALARRATAIAGEPALAGGRGVVGWVEGTRRGTGLQQVVGAAWPTFGPAAAPPSDADDVMLVTEDSPLDEPALAAASPFEPPQRPTVSRRSGPPPPRPCPDLLLLTQRQNE